MNADDREMLEKIFARYHTPSDDAWPSTVQIAFDIGWLTGMVMKLDDALKKATSDAV